MSDETQNPNINIDGNVSGGNVNIGGQQTFNQQLRPSQSTCPTAPNPPEHFTGRTRELQDLRQALTSGERVAITAVRAIGGMGKTSLAQALCHHADSPFDAVLWAEIHEEPQTINILLDWARYAVDDYALPPDAKAEDIANWVRGQLTQLMQKADGCGTRWLVVFDDVWNTPASYESVRLLQSALPPDTRQLITTRQLDTATQLQARPIELHALTDDEALVLMRKLTTHAALTDAHLTRVVTLIKGHPLTLEIAAASLNEAEDAADLTHILDEYERGIRDGSPFDALRLDVETPRALNVVFGRSYKRLPQTDQQRFRALGVMPTDARWTRAIAGGVWGESDPVALTKAHKTLRLAAFIQQDEQASAEYGDTRYTLHPLLRAYARALLNEAGEHDTVFLRYAAYFTKQAEQFKTRPPQEWRDTIERDVLHVLAVGDELVKRQEISDFQELALEFAYHTTNFVHRRMEHQRRAWLEMGLALSREAGHVKRESLFLNELGLLWSALGEKHKALKYYEQALPLRRAVGNRAGEATTLSNIGGVWSDLGEKHKALDYCQQALPIFRAVDDRMGEATTLNNIGMVWDDLGEKHKALDYYEQALPIQHAVGNQEGEAATLNNIGMVWDALGDKHKALGYYQRALPMHRDVGNRQMEAATLNNIGMVWDALGDKHKALDYYQQALPISRAVGDRAGEATTLNNIGGMWEDLGEKHKALEYFEQVLPIQRAVGDRAGEATTLNNIGMVWDALGDKHKALDYYQQALPISSAVGDRAGEATTLNNIGVVYRALDEPHKALDYYQQARLIQRAMGDHAGEATTLNNMGYIYFQSGDLARTVEIQRQTLEIFRSVGNIASETAILFNLAVALAQMGERDEAITLVQQSIAILERYNLPQDAAGATIAQHQQFLAQLIGQSAPQASQKEQATEVIRMLTGVYAQGGADLVRQMLKGQVPEEVVEQIIMLLSSKGE